MQTVLDFSLYGTKEAVLRFLRVVGWYVATAVVAGIITLLADYQGVINEQNLILVSAFGLLNATLAAIQVWLHTVRPSVNIPVQG